MVCVLNFTLSPVYAMGSVWFKWFLLFRAETFTFKHRAGFIELFFEVWSITAEIKLPVSNSLRV